MSYLTISAFWLECLINSCLMLFLIWLDLCHFAFYMSHVFCSSVPPFLPSYTTPLLDLSGMPITDVMDFLIFAGFAFLHCFFRFSQLYFLTLYWVFSSAVRFLISEICFCSQYFLLWQFPFHFRVWYLFIFLYL